MSSLTSPTPVKRIFQHRRKLRRVPRFPKHPVYSAEPRPRLPATARRARTPLWSPPIRPGRLPVYDEALRYIRADSRALHAEIDALKKAYTARAAADAKAGRTHDSAALDAYKKKRGVLEVLSEVNLPEVRWAFVRGRFPFTKPVYRHLTEQKWRNSGALDLLMERLHQMHVIPDLLPDLRPTVDLRVQFRQPDATPATVHTRGFVPVQPGTFLHPAQTLGPPRVSATVFHPEPRLYTMMLLDPDVPDQANGSFQTHIHWLQPNITLTGDRRITLIPASPTAPLPYIPPYPQRGTPYHRYVLLLLPHTSPTPLPITPALAPSRMPFNLRAFCAQWGLDGAQGGGAHMWRAVWDATVSEIYRDVLHFPEPRYGRLPKLDPYAGSSRSRYGL